ncbi:MAG: phage holin family protein [Bacteroidota bacterium]
MEDLKTRTEELTDHIEGFTETFLKLTFTTIAQKGINISSVLLNILLVYVCGVFVLLFIAVGLAWWLGDIVHNRAAGFFIVGGLFFLITVLIILLRKKIIYPFIRNSLVKKIYE